MLNILRTLILVFVSILILTACGEGETPATTAADKTKAAVTEETPAVVIEGPEATGGAMEQVEEPVAETPAETITPSEAPVATPVTTDESAAPEAKTAEATSSAPIDGGQLYNTYCAICHRAGMNAAPKYGSKPLWAKRIAQGRETMYSHAINGLRGMPARGGFAQLTDDEVKAGVDYMVRAAGGWKD